MTKKKLQKYIQEITGQYVNIEFDKLKKYSAIYYPDINTIVFDPKKLNKAVIWHECGHIISFPFVENKSRIEQEIYGHLFAILLAILKKRPRIKKLLISHLDDPGWYKNNTYRKARSLILKRLNELKQL